jgi:hypothetical protein
MKTALPGTAVSGRRREIGNILIPQTVPLQVGKDASGSVPADEFYFIPLAVPMGDPLGTGVAMGPGGCLR